MKDKEILTPSVLILDSAGMSRDVVALMKAAKVHTGGFEYMAPKFSFFLIKIKRLECRAVLSGVLDRWKGQLELVTVG